MDNKILDLSVFKQYTFDITFPDGSLLKVKKPTQAIVIEMVALSQLDQAAVLEGLIEICAAILSNNTEGKTYTAEWVAAELDIVMVSAIVKGYSVFIQEIQNDPF